MKVAFISDVHGNLEALEAVLADVQRKGAERIFCLGDIVGYGPNPHECLALVRENCGIVVRGNHEDGLLDDDYARVTMGSTAYEVIKWTRERLTPDDLSYIEGLPYTATVEPNGTSERRILLAHAQFFEPRMFLYLAEQDDGEGVPEFLNQLHEMSYGDRLFIGHHHYPSVLHYVEEEPEVDEDYNYYLQRNSCAIVVVGSVGQPRTSETKDAQYALYDAVRDTFCFHHVPYDWRTTVAKIEGCGFSEQTQKALVRQLTPEDV